MASTARRAPALGLAILALNLWFSAVSLDWAARRSPNLLMVVALCELHASAWRRSSRVMLLAEALFGWADVVVLGLTLFGTHLGLLFWELRSVSFSLAAPGLRRDQLP